MICLCYRLCYPLNNQRRKTVSIGKRKEYGKIIQTLFFINTLVPKKGSINRFY